MATLSIMGLYKYDNTIFDDFKLPAAIDRDIFIKNLLFETAELECLMSNPSAFKYFAGAYSDSRIDAWTRVAEVLSAEYNPIHNYDRHEEWEENGSGSSTENVNNGGADVSKLDKSAFNSSNYQPAEKNTVDYGGTQSASSAANNKNIHSGHLYGNIGVTTTQQMMQEEINIRTNSIYAFIINDIKQHFCVLVY